MFRQEIVEGRQVERLDNWLRVAEPLDDRAVRARGAGPLLRPGRERPWQRIGFAPRWVETERRARDPARHPDRRLRRRLRRTCSGSGRRRRRPSSTSSCSTRATTSAPRRRRTQSESISKILYPNDDVEKGRELRLMQEYFFVACSIGGRPPRFPRARARPPRASGLRRVPAQRHAPGAHRRRADATSSSTSSGSTGPTAWDLVVRCVGYTNHTLLPEALEKWPATMLGNVLPAPPPDHPRDRPPVRPGDLRTGPGPRRPRPERSRRSPPVRPRSSAWPTSRRSAPTR